MLESSVWYSVVPVGYMEFVEKSIVTIVVFLAAFGL